MSMGRPRPSSVHVALTSTPCQCGRKILLNKALWLLMPTSTFSRLDHYHADSAHSHRWLTGGICGKSSPKCYQCLSGLSQARRRQGKLYIEVSCSGYLRWALHSSDWPLQTKARRVFKVWTVMFVRLHPIARQSLSLALCFFEGFLRFCYQHLGYCKPEVSECPSCACYREGSIWSVRLF